MKKITKIECIKAIPTRMRVAAYARVSTGSDEQLQSLETPKEHYENYIKAHPDMEFAGLYYDEGISGTKVEKREGLLKLLADCESGKIDRVITKSISRFSRNTTDCLEMVRNLTKLGVHLYFEKENIDTAHMSSELMLSILSSIAESESRSISENTKWSITRRYEDGTFIISYPPYGYENADGKMVIVPEEAAVVEEIFERTISGQGSYVIARWLNESGVPSKRGAKWHSSTVEGILKNEKYTGDVIFQKTYTDENFNRHTNYGERNMYIYKKHHAPIISYETFETAANVIAQRAKEKSIKSGDGKYQKRYPFSGKIRCGECGATFKRRTHYKPSGDYIAWTCCNHITDKNSCSMLYIKDVDVRKALVRLMRKLQFSRTQVLKPFITSLKSGNCQDRLVRVNEIEFQLEKILEQQNVLTRIMSAGYIEPSLYQIERGALLAEEDTLNREKELISKGINGEMSCLNEANKLIRYLEKQEDITEFEDAWVQDYIECITVQSRNQITFELKCGLALPERLI